MQLSSRRGLWRQPRRLSRCKYRFSSPRHCEPPHQPEWLVRHQLVLRRLSRRQHLLQQPLRISAEHNRSVEIQSHGHHHRHRRMGQHPPRIVSALRNSEFKRHPPFSRRPQMVRPRMELLARHAAVLFVDLVSYRSVSDSSVMSSGVETSLTVNSKRCHVIRTSGSISSRIAIEEMIVSREDRTYQSNEPKLAGLKRRRAAGQTTVRDFSTSHPAPLEMTKRYL